MSRKHFQAMAEIIRLSGTDGQAKLVTATLFAELATTFNGRFDRARFFRACGLDSK